MRKAPVRAADNGNTEICGVARFRCRKHAGRIAPRGPRPLDWTDAAEPECRNAEGVRGCGRFGCSWDPVRPSNARGGAPAQNARQGGGSFRYSTMPPQPAPGGYRGAYRKGGISHDVAGNPGSL